MNTRTLATRAPAHRQDRAEADSNITSPVLRRWLETALLVERLGRADVSFMGDVVVQRWRRYGRDRLYVNDAEGLRLGWLDVSTGDDHVDIPDRVDEFRAAVAKWRADQGLASDDVSVTGPVSETAAVAARVGAGIGACVVVADDVVIAPAPAGEPQWEDLAERQPGAMARKQAIALKQAAPVRTFVARALGVRTDERAWRIGADGEEKVAARLAKLANKDPRWRFLHAIPVGEAGSDIDHLVVGPGGVFTLNAKHHPGARIWICDNAFRVNNTPVPYIRNSRHEAQRAGRYLTTACGFPVVVAGIIVPVGADSITIKQAPADVHVVNRMAISDWLRRRPLTLDDTTISAVFDAARRSTTWHQEN